MSSPSIGRVGPPPPARPPESVPRPAAKEKGASPRPQLDDELATHSASSPASSRGSIFFNGSWMPGSSPRLSGSRSEAAWNFSAGHARSPSPLAGEGGPKGRMRGARLPRTPDFVGKFQCAFRRAPHPPFGHLLPQGEKGGAERHVLAEPSLHFAGMSAHLPRSAFSMHFKAIDAVCVAGTGQPWPRARARRRMALYLLSAVRGRVAAPLSPMVGRPNAAPALTSAGLRPCRPRADRARSHRA